MARRRWSLVLLTAFVIQSSAAENPGSRDLHWLLEHRVRIQSPALGPGWHEGLFNRQRREPACYVVIVWKPRPSPESSLQAASTVELKAVSELQAYSGPRTPVSTWAGRHSKEASDDSLWRPIPPAALDGNRDCSAATERWFLMSRHGDCAAVATLKRKVPDLGEINDPQAFAVFMRHKGYTVTSTRVPVPKGSAQEVKVPEKDLFLMFVTSEMCGGSGVR